MTSETCHGTQSCQAGDGCFGQG